MTAFIIFLSIIVAIVYSTISGTTWVGPGTLTVYVWAFIAGLATAVIFAFRSWLQGRGKSSRNIVLDASDDECRFSTRPSSPPGLASEQETGASVMRRSFLFRHISDPARFPVAALILVANFAGSHIAWGTSDPTLVSAILDTATASYFILGGQTRWELVIGFLFLGSVGLALLTFLDVIPDHTERASGFIALSFPDLSSILGHLATPF